MEIREDRKYTKDHEWAKLEGTDLRVGISAFAVSMLGDITMVNFDVRVGDRVEAGKAFGTVESVKTLSDLFAPASGTVIALNEGLDLTPELVNEDCWEKGWMLTLRLDAPGDYDALLSPSAYGEVVAAADH